MLKDNLEKKVNVALIPIEDSIPEERQVHYDWIGNARAAYSLDLWELADQRIMTLEPIVPSRLYNNKDKLHFQAASAQAAIGALTVRALRTMVSSRPEAFQVLLVCSWNIKSHNVHREMLATRELCYKLWAMGEYRTENLIAWFYYTYTYTDHNPTLSQPYILSQKNLVPDTFEKTDLQTLIVQLWS